MIPEDITSRSFLVSLRGYDRDEVHAFLAQVADEMAELQERIDELEELATAPAPAPAVAVAAESTPPGEAAEVSALVAAAAPANPSEMFAQIGQETQRILQAAQAAGEDLRKRAADDAERQVKEARSGALRIIAEGERRREAVDSNVAELTEARDNLAADLRELGRSVERSLRELVAEPEPTRTVREGVTASLREAAAGPDPDADVEFAAATAHPVEAEVEAEPSAADGAEESEPAADAGVDVASAADEAAAPATGEDADEAEDVPAAVVDERAVLVDPASRDVDPVVLERAHALRAQALAPLHPKLVRKLKRGLQDVQNGMLDRLRRADGKGEPASFLPPPDAVEGLTQLAEEFLFSAWWGGCASGELLADDEVDVPGSEGSFADALIRKLMDQLTADLEAGLRLGFGAGDNVAALSDRVGVAFAALREEPLEEESALALLHTYEEGMRAAWQVGGATHRVWARATEPPCTDPRCAQNHEVGPVPLDDPFSSGHLHPPVRVGCNCTTVPAIPESEPAS